jgi:poly(A) polymerase
VWEHLKSCTKHFTEDHGLDVRLATLFHDCGKAETFSVAGRIRFDHHAEKSAELVGHVLKRLAVPTTRIRKIQWLIEHHMMMDAFGKLSDERKAHWYFHPWFKELLQVMELDIRGTDPGSYGLYDSIIKDYDEYLNNHPHPPRALLKGDEVMALLGLKPGEEVGRILRELHDAQARKEVTTKAEAKKFITNRNSAF